MARLKFLSVQVIDSLRQRIRLIYDGDKLAIEMAKKRLTVGEARMVAEAVTKVIEEHDRFAKKLSRLD